MTNRLFSKATMLLTAAGLILNILLVWATDLFGIPLYLDSIGTVIAAALGGVLPGIAVGFLSNCVTSLLSVSPDPMTLYYGFLNVIIAVVAAHLSRKGAFLRWRGRVLGAAAFALVGGALGSVVTWVLYGFSFGQGISAPLANFLYNSLHISEFAAQFGADMVIDTVDKVITVAVLCLTLGVLPKAALEKLPLGFVYLDGPDMETKKRGAPRTERSVRRQSIRTKITLLIVVSTSILSAIALVIGSSSYKNRLIEQYSDMCQDAVAMMLPKIDGDKIDTYLAQGENASGYADTERELYDILNHAQRLKYMYVYSIRQDGCHVVFDLDTDELAGEEPGYVLAFDASFPYVSELIAGQSIPPVITNDTYGWLLTVYKPVYNSAGSVVAYAAADIDMREIKTDIYSYVIGITSLLFGAVIIITAFSLWYCDKKLLDPMGILVEKARSFDFEGRMDSAARHKLSVNTGDEIEEVFNAMCRTEKAIGDHISQLKQKNLEISHMQRNIIYALANMVENRDGNTGGHIKRTAAYVELIARRLQADGEYAQSIPDEYVNMLYDSAPLHDIGKVKIPDAILNKPGRLTDEEFELMKRHTTEGGNILQSSLSDIEDGSWLSMAVNMAKYHHERWDGTGYPEGVAGASIPLCARIMAVSDVFDALVSVRSYKDAYSFEEAMEILREGAGTQFDARIVSVFQDASKQVREIMERD